MESFSRPLSLVLACVATSLIFTSVTLVFTAGAHPASGTQVATLQAAAATVQA